MSTAYVFDGKLWRDANEGATITATATDSDGFTLGATKPSASNTGAQDSLLTGTLYGDQVINTAGTTIRNKRIQGYVVVNAANVTLQNCVIVGRNVGYTGRSGLVQCNSSGTRIIGCTIRPAYPRYFLNGISGKGFRAYRCDISQGVDAIAMKGSNCSAEGSYLHDLAFFDGRNTLNGNGSDHAHDSRFPGWTHNDGVQIYGYANNRVTGCFIKAYFSSSVGTPNTAAVTGCSGGNNNGRIMPRRNYANGITCAPTSARLDNAVISSNWFEGGEVSIQIPAQGRGYDSGNTIAIKYNRFGLDQKPGYTGNPVNPHQYMRYVASLGTFTLSGNKYDNTTSVPLHLRNQAIPAGVLYGGQKTWQVTK